MTLRIWFKGRTLFLLSGVDQVRELEDFLRTMMHIRTLLDNSLNEIRVWGDFKQERKYPENFIEFYKENNISHYDLLFELEPDYPGIWDNFLDYIAFTSCLFEFHREKDLEQMAKWLIKIYFFSRNDLFSIFKLKPFRATIEPLLKPILLELGPYRWRYFFLYLFLQMREYLLFIPCFCTKWVKENIGWWGSNIFSMLPFTILLYFAFHGYVYATIILSFWIGCRFIKYIARFLWSFYQGYFLLLEERIHFILQLPFSLLTSLYLLTAFSVLLENYYPDYIWLSVLLFSQIRLFFSLCKHWGPFIIEKATIYFKAGKD